MTESLDLFFSSFLRPDLDLSCVLSHQLVQAYLYQVVGPPGQ